MKKRNESYHTRNVSGKFWLAAAVTVLLCASGRFQVDLGNESLTVLQVFFTYSREELLRLGEDACSYQVLTGFRGMEWFVVGIPLVAAFPSVYDFAEQWFGGSYYQIISRKSRLRYAIENLWKAFYLGFSAMVTGILIYAVLVYLKFPSLSAYHLSPEESSTVYFYGETVLERGITILQSILHTGLLAGTMAILCMVLVIVIKDRFMAVSLPVLLEYLSIKVESVYSSYLYGKYGFSEIPPKERIVEFFLPSSHLFFSHTFELNYGLPYWCYLLLMGVVIFLIFLLFWRLIERRSE